MKGVGAATACRGRIWLGGPAANNGTTLPGALPTRSSDTQAWASLHYPIRALCWGPRQGLASEEGMALVPAPQLVVTDTCSVT